MNHHLVHFPWVFNTKGLNLLYPEFVASLETHCEYFLMCSFCQGLFTSGLIFVLNIISITNVSISHAYFLGSSGQDMPFVRGVT